MFKKLLNTKVLKNQKGLTLIELLAVIVILAIVAAIAIPAIGNIIENSRVKAAKADIVSVINGANIYFTDNSSVTLIAATGTGAKPLADLDAYVESYGNFTVTKVEKSTTTGNKIWVSGSVEIGNDTYTVTNANLDDLKPSDTNLTEKNGTTSIFAKQ